MPTQKAMVMAAIGLHARPAAAFVRAVAETGLPVTISRPGLQSVDARSLLQVMAADFPCGCEVELAIEDAALDSGVSREKAIEGLKALGRLLESQGSA